MRSLLVSGCVAIALFSAAPASAQLDVGSGLMGAGVGAAIGAIAGGGRGAATGAIVGGSVGAVTGAFRPGPGYAYPYHVAHRGCRWIPAHYNRWGEWRPGHCAGTSLKQVIPGRPERPSPGSRNTRLWNMDSGLAAAWHPGTTTEMSASVARRSS